MAQESQKEAGQDEKSERDPTNRIFRRQSTRNLQADKQLEEEEEDSPGCQTPDKVKKSSRASDVKGPKAAAAK